MRKSKNTFVVIGSIIVIVSVALVYVFGGNPAKIELNDAGITVSGMYGDTYLYEDIDEIKLITEEFEITERTSGSSIGSVLRGNFSTTEYGAVTLFIDTEIKVYISIQMGNDIVIFNLPSIEETNTFYQELLTYIPA
ncbi:MAG: hypothetical protein V3569_02605 [Acholeplasmataceae bacterium]|nr:hypothetical protein [Acholeplasmataceae bacterium]